MALSKYRTKKSSKFSIKYRNRITVVLVQMLLCLKEVAAAYNSTGGTSVSRSSSNIMSRISTSPTLPTYSQTPSRQSTSAIRESVVIPSSDPEREAQELYEKSLREYGAVEGRSTRKVCATWELLNCHCSGPVNQVKLVCRSVGFREIPLEIPMEVINLDLSDNNITELVAKSFETVPNLEDLTLSDNKLEKIDPEAFLGLSKLKRLSLQNCGLTVIPGESLKRIPKLAILLLNGNALDNLDDVRLDHLHYLRTLRLEGNLLERIPAKMLAGLKSLEALNLGNNLISTVSEGDFSQMHNLVVLLLKRNLINQVARQAFSDLTNLKILDLDDNLLSSVPSGLDKLVHMQELHISSKLLSCLNNLTAFWAHSNLTTSLFHLSHRIHKSSAAGNRIQSLNKTDFSRYLQVLDLRANILTTIATEALQNMPRLRKLTLSDIRTLKHFPSLQGCLMLENIRLDRAGISEVPYDLCKYSPRLKSLTLKSNQLYDIPDLRACKELRLLDMASNLVTSLHGKRFEGLGQLNDLLLSDNQIETIPYDSFFGIPRLQNLDLEGNRIMFIHELAFKEFSQLEELNLGNNIFPNLPSAGLHRLLHLKTFNNPKLREFPAPESFPRIQTLVLSYAYHCCPFLPLVTLSATKRPTEIRETVLFPTNEIDLNLWNQTQTDFWPQISNMSNTFGTKFKEIFEGFGNDFTYPGNLPTYVEEYFEEENTPIRPLGSDVTPGSVQCLPLPGPFLPCTDLFDWWTLRCGVWVVFLLAMLGNGTVVFVLVFSRSKMDVPRFLVCNLAAADFFMGVYLGFLAVVDASTLGEFRMYAIPWQMSVVCQIAGFLAVLSSELSVYTLAVITLERNYAITHAIHLNKRLSLKQATYIMIFGWIFAITMAILPLVGISDYRKFAVCLPFETTTGLASLAYVVTLMFVNGCAFLTLMGCYLKMYWAIRGSQAWNTNDSRIAKRMALLVFTDFLCWSPIAFFSLTAIFGLQLISLEQAKIFTVFILPLNSCCNPFLYAIMTKQFKKDCVMICKAIEESRVSRTIGRLDHRPTRELPPLLGTPGCRCVKMMPHEAPRRRETVAKEPLWTRAWNRLLCRKKQTEGRRRPTRADTYAYQFAEVQKAKKTVRASSISSENFCSSRSSSWRHGPPPAHNCAIPLRMIDSRRRHSAWLITRKTSQDSNLSSSRNDSSASATTASTSTFRLSRSSAGSTTPLPSIIGNNKQNSNNHQKPRLVRQQAVVQEEEDSSPPRLGVRFLPTIPSAADSSVVIDEDSHDQTISTQFYTVLQGTSSHPKTTTLSSPEDKKSPTDKPP